MIGKNLKKHYREFKRYFDNFKFEMGDGGVYFPKAQATMGGMYSHWNTGFESDIQHDHNIIPDEGLNKILNEIFGAGVHVATWYAMLHSGSGTPAADLTAANYNATLSEITSGSEGYSEATRVEWEPDAVDTVNTEIVNDATPAQFTIVTAGTLVVRGAAIVSVSTKGSTSGILMSAGKFTSARNESNGNEFNLKYKIDFDQA